MGLHGMIHRLLEQRLREAVLEVLPGVDPGTVRVLPCPDVQFGDYQVSALMGLARSLKRNPRQLALDVLARLEVAEWCEQPEVAGGGFINFRVRPEAVCRLVASEAEGDGAFFREADRVRTVVVDFSSPNVAKPMHVGHIRSTVLGDCLARVLRCLGHRVVTDNHLGDWGTQFGKLILGWKRHLNPERLTDAPLEEMERLYRLVNEACERDPAVLAEARSELARLQGGDVESRAVWARMIEVSRQEFDRVYARLGVKFDKVLGESFYDSRLGGVVAELEARGLARLSEGALVVFFDDLPELSSHPMIVRKSDGASNYATTDLATLEYRWAIWRPDDILYVTDGRQQLHFRQVFAAFRKWHPEATARLQHIWFGAILGEDGKPFRTRSGETVRLTDLLDEAEERAYQVVSMKSPALDEGTRREIARIVGLGAVKYADLLPNRQSDYVFSWDKMLALNGNTAPYLQYAYTRIRSIQRRAAEAKDGPGLVREGAVPSAVEELGLAKQLMNFGLVLEAVSEESRPNHLCNYLYELAGRFARFYERCPVLKSDASERVLRLQLCELTARVLRVGLGLLGIETSDRM
jgi:arginyl-tRNA synthetase